MKCLILTLVLLGTVTMTLDAQSNDTTQRIDELFSQWNNATPGGSIAVARKGEVIYSKAFGLADLEHNVPNTTQTIFECGSVSKQFTAAAILLLETEGKLSLKDDVRKYIPELPAYQAPITIQHLIHHTSGLRDWGTMGALAGWPRTTKVYTLDIALEIICRQKALNFTPGERYSYSNSNYTLLVAIIERVSKETLSQFTRARFFEPLGMHHTQWRDNFREVIVNRAIAYSKSGSVFQQEMPFENIHGHGGLLTTTDDLLAWNSLLESNAIGGTNFTARRIQKGTLNDGTEINYAAGLFIDKVNGYNEINHSGATAAYRAWMAYYPQKKLSVVVLSNDGSFSPATMGHQIAEIFLGKDVKGSFPPHKEVTVAPGDLKKFEAKFKSRRGWVVSFTVKDDKVYFGNDPMITLQRDSLYLNGTTYVWKKKDQILLQLGSDTLTYVRKDDPQLNPTFMREMAGDYYSEDANATYSVLVNETTHSVSIQCKPFPPFGLNPVYKDGYLTGDKELYEFTRDKHGKVIGFEVSTSRAERVPFRKIAKSK